MRLLGHYHSVAHGQQQEEVHGVLGLRGGKRAREFELFSRSMYRGLGIYDVKGSVCFVLKFALPPFSPPLPSVVEISKQNRHRTFDIINT